MNVVKLSCRVYYTRKIKATTLLLNSLLVFVFNNKVNCFVSFKSRCINIKFKNVKRRT